MRILLLEDNDLDATLVMRLIGSPADQGPALDAAPVIVRAVTLSAALEHIRAESFDLIVTDLQVPDSMGIDTFLALRAQALSTPFVVLTGTYNDESLGIEAVRKGAQDYLIKQKVDASMLRRSILYALERHRLEEALKKSRDELEIRVQERTAELATINRDLETMLDVITHDLKEPLRTIAIFSDKLEKSLGERLDDKERDTVHRILMAIDRMQHLLDDVRALTQARSVEFPKEEVSGKEVVADAILRLESQIQLSNASIRISEDLPRMHANKGWAVEAIYNLVSNSLKFTINGKSPDVEIAGYRGPEGIGIAVKDRGPGVKPEYAEQIFKLFKRGVGREVEGTGAGLAIVRKVAERHGGQAWARPRTGGGSEFVITFGK